MSYDMVYVLGASGFIGSALADKLRAQGPVSIPTRTEYNLLNPVMLRLKSMIYITAAMSRFIDCESNPDSWRINVDAPLWIARHHPESHIVWLSSEAVERAIHTAYGQQKAFCEMGLLALPNTTVIRIPKQTQETRGSLVQYMSGLYDPQGLVRWPI